QLWVVSNDGRLWSSPKGNSWFRHGDLEQGRPVSIQAVAGAIYIAGAGDDGRGIVWGPRKHDIPVGNPPPALVSQSPNRKVATDWKAAGRKIDALLADPASYAGNGISEARQLIAQASVNGAPSGFFAERLKAELPSVTIRAFGGGMQLNAKEFARSLVLSGMEKAGHANVPISYLAAPWTSKPNSYEKYFEVVLSALRAVAASGQNDRKTLEALLARMDFANDPPWLRSQVIGTLTAVSGKHFGYDIGAWKNWAGSRNETTMRTAASYQESTIN
ncbi:hypothetical protein, partial [Parasphingorhabdus sp.]